MRPASLLAVLLLGGSARAWAQGAPELQPLVVTAPRLKVLQPEMIDPLINMTLLRLLQNRANARPQSQDMVDASLGNLAKLATVTGYMLKTRYAELGFLLTEGLAGVRDFQLASELERVARQGTNVQTRAAALVALAYTKDARYEPLLQQMLTDTNITVRFGALEGLVILGAPSSAQLINQAASSDSSAIVQLSAAAAMWRSGNVYGREILLKNYQDKDWLVRAICARYLGELGGPDEYAKLFQQLATEDNPQVKAELVSGLLHLLKYAPSAAAPAFPR